MSLACPEVRHLLEGMAGEVTGEVAAHLAVCPACRLHAGLLRVLASCEPLPADREAVERILTVLPVAPWQRRRLATWLPLLAGVALTGAGVALLGGVPAASTLAALLAGVGDVAASDMTRAWDALLAVRSSSVALRALVAGGGVWLVIWLVLAAAGSTVAAWRLARRREGVDRP
ncbi:MAG: hypothetical protein HXY19_05250 [Thermoanaerobaculaceae bacterium]|nr:hypothetical protein [Thermoanaerobaculaceae bacterium]